MLMLGGSGVAGKLRWDDGFCFMSNDGAWKCGCCFLFKSAVNIKYLRYTGTFQRLWIWNGYDN